MESFFLIAVLVAALLGLIVVVFGIRSLMRRDETEISGLQLRGAGRRIGAVARTTIAEGLRMKLAVVFLTIMLAAMPLLAYFGVADGTIKGRVQMFLGYVLGLATFLLALLTIVLSTRSLAGEISGKQVFGLASKPIPRWQIVFGKWTGVTLLNAAMLGIAGVGTYVGVRYIMGSFHRQMRDELVERGGLTSEQADACVDAIDGVRGPGPIGVDSPIIPAMSEALGWDDKSTEDRDKRYQRVLELLGRLPESTRANLRRLDEVRRQVLVSRASVAPAPPDPTAAVEQQFKKLKAAGQLPENMTENRVREQLTSEAMIVTRIVPPRVGRLWHLQGPPPIGGRDFLLSVRYKLEGYTPAYTAPNGITYREETFVPSWCVGNPDSPSAYFWPEGDVALATNAWTEFELPTNAVRPDGQIELRFANVDPRNTEAVFAVNGLEVLYTAGSWPGNLLRAWIALMLPLMLLGAMGVFFSTFCTFPVGLLVTLVLYVAGITGGFLAESIGITGDVFPEYPNKMDEFRRNVGQTALKLLTITRIDVSQRLVEGRLLDWPTLLAEAASTVLLRGTIFMVLAIHIFRRRELAAIIV